MKKGEALAEDVVLLRDSGQPADRRADDDPDSVGVGAVHRGVAPCLLRGAEREQDVAVHPRASLGGATDDGSKPFTSPAIRTGKPLVSKPWMKSTPLSPATAACQVDGASRPIGVIAPSPVTATLRTGQS